MVLRQHEIGVETLPTTGLPNLGKDPAPISAVLDDKPIPDLNAPVTNDIKGLNLSPYSSTSTALPLPANTSGTTLPPVSAVPPATSSGYSGLLSPSNPPSAGFLPGNSMKLP